MYTRGGTGAEYRYRTKECAGKIVKRRTYIYIKKKWYLERAGYAEGWFLKRVESSKRKEKKTVKTYPPTGVWRAESAPGSPLLIAGGCAVANVTAANTQHVPTTSRAIGVRVIIIPPTCCRISTCVPGGAWV